MNPKLREEINKRIIKGGTAADMDLHVHTRFSDGKNSAEEMVLAAIDKGIKVLGFSEHSPVAGEDWCMDARSEEEYRRTIPVLREKYRDRISIYCGVEQEAISGHADAFYDYVIGSAHAVKAGNGIVWADSTKQEVTDAVEKYYGGDYYAYAEVYFSNEACVDEVTGCDIIGHFDLLAKFNEGNVLFDTAHPRYISAWKAAVDRLSGKNLIFEINTGAIARGYRSTPYPAGDIADYLRKKGEAMILSSDSHDVSTMAYEFEKWRLYADLPIN